MGQLEVICTFVARVRDSSLVANATGVAIATEMIVAFSLNSRGILPTRSSVCLRRKRGEHNRAIGRSRGGRTTKLHVLSDPFCRPVVLHLTPGQDADIAAAPDVLALAPPMSALLADKGYDGDNLRAESLDTAPSPSFPINPTVSSSIASTNAPTKAEMSLNAAFAGSRTSGASPYDIASSPGISWPLFHLAALVAYWLD
ncbi:hypothetical protein ACVWWG_001906 [Bradyrhizobium sp. LB7.2]